MEKEFCHEIIRKKVILLAFDFERESLRMALDSIKERKLRSFLTVLGIVIGISAIIAMVSIGEGTKASIMEALGGLGANTIFVTSGGGGGGFSSPTTGETLTEKDIAKVESVKDISLALGIFVKSLPATFKSEVKILSLYGVDTKNAFKFFSEIGVVEIEEGRYFRTGERRAIVIGRVMADKAFSTELKLNDKFKVKDETFHIIGITKETGNTQYDNIIIVPIEDIRDLSTEKDQLTIIFAKADNPNRIDEIAEDIQKKMDDAHGKKLFSVFTTKQLTERIGTVTNTISIVLGGIAGIALIVAGIGIANTMLMSVIERTREIGIMKAIGASNRNVMEIFLMEAAMIGLIGGILGGIVGMGLSNALELVLTSYGMAFKTLVTPELFAGGVVFSIIVGVFFGLLPARKASKLNPIEALRYE